MILKKAKLLLGILLIAIFALLFYILFLYYRSLPKNTYQIARTTHIPQKQNIKKDHSWLESLLKKPQSYSYPATEIKIGVHFKSPNEKANLTRLIVNHLDDYKFFCLNEVLKEENIDFAYYQSNDSINIVIFLPNDSRKKQIMQDLKYYEIQYKVQ
ncbi:hypothetical protein [Helicobacter sp. 11S03491-1]|uniref:hypothetical protein n=1 Tax=Helicobacter sp. 11S03491-1 TaxID=1476196 RepID=UPI000BA4FC00|nr:hypothetical protein [Helicobacter sp. 11S03491-1]PAF42563.1 hypothetical protein BKH45_03355 [Helicobacter sp. 11S03491-1]